ncbi:unnamed protein product [Prunus brigantina]
MLRKDSRALGNTLVTFTNKNNNSLQINSWLGMRSLWHGSKIVMSLALKRKLSVPRGKTGSDEGKRMGMHAGSKGDLSSNIPWSLGCLLLETCSLPMCWNLPTALYNGPSDFPFVAFVFPAKCWGFCSSLW